MLERELHAMLYLTLPLSLWIALLGYLLARYLQSSVGGGMATAASALLGLALLWERGWRQRKAAMRKLA